MFLTSFVRLLFVLLSLFQLYLCWRKSSWWFNSCLDAHFPMYVAHENWYQSNSCILFNWLIGRGGGGDCDFVVVDDGRWCLKQAFNHTHPPVPFEIRLMSTISREKKYKTRRRKKSRIYNCRIKTATKMFQLNLISSF